MYKLKLASSIFIIFSVLTSCYQPFKSRKKIYSERVEDIQKCRKSWTYKSFKDTIQIKLLFHKSKMGHFTISHPNFYIGIATNGDTIGMLDYYSETDFEKGDYIKFLPDPHGPRIKEKLRSMGSGPVLYIGNLRKEKELQCKIDTIYYGQVIE